MSKKPAKGPNSVPGARPSVRGWLRSLGLGQYETLFRENDIDAEILGDLTDRDLEKIGVSLGHRKRLLKAVAALAGPVPASPTTSTPIRPASDAAERRQLTVMFCDLVGSTAMSARLDPEDMREIVGAYHRCCAELITKVGGFVAKYMGDGVLTYFGYPQAQAKHLLGERRDWFRVRHGKYSLGTSSCGWS